MTMTTELLAKKNRNSDIFCLVSVVLFFLIKFLVPAANGLTPAGVNLLSVFIPCIFLWIFVDTGWPSLLALMVLVGLNVIPMGTALGVGFGTNTTWLTIGYVYCSLALKESGVLDKIAMWLVSRKITDGKPYAFLIVFLAGMMLIGVWMSHAVTIILFSTIGASVCESVNIKKGEKMYTAVLISVLWTCIIAEAIIPYGKITAMTVMAVMEGFGYTLDLPRYLKMSIPFAILYIALAFLVLRFFLRPEVDKFKSYSGEEFRQKLKALPFTRKEKISIVIYIILIVSLLIPSMTFMPNVSAFFARNGAAWMPLICVAAMAYIRIDGKPIVPLGRGLSEMPWPTMVFMAASLVFATIISSPDMGVTTMLANALTSAISGVGASGLTIVAIAAFAVTIVATNFISNSVVAAVATAAFVPVLAKAYEAGQTNLHPWAVAGMIIMMAGASYLTPPASAMVPFILGPHVEVKDSFKISSLLVAFTFLLALVIVFVIGY